jgi:Ni/Fe-hydrogenase subunit HybB-like protein
MAGNRDIGLGRAILYVLVALGGIAALLRLTLGLGATTNLSDAYPWGLWISFDVLTGVALASGGYIMTAVIYVFDLKKYHPLLRPAKLSAFLGYLLFAFGLFLDLGMPWRIWHPMIMWNPHSVLFEVSWCVMLYTTVLGLDIFIMALERWRAEKWVSFFRSIYVVNIVAAIVLSTLHQSSLGALYLVMPEKMSGLWATGAIGPLFLVSAIVGGMGIITLESLISARIYGRKPETGILSGLAKAMAVMMLIYFVAKVVDILVRGVTIWSLDSTHLLFHLELLVPMILPVLLLALPKVRNSVNGLLWISCTAALWVVLTRFNVSLTAYAGYQQMTYFPSLVEIAVTVALVAMGILLFDWAARYLPIYLPDNPATRLRPTTETRSRR